MSASAPTDEILDIMAKAPNAAQAEKLANAVANRFVSYLSSENSVIETGEAQQLGAESNVLSAEVAQYKGEILTDQNQLNVGSRRTECSK